MLSYRCKASSPCPDICVVILKILHCDQKENKNISGNIWFHSCFDVLAVQEAVLVL